MKKIFYNILLFTMMSGSIAAQAEGDISYISSQHYYVRFNNTTGLSEGDTLYSENKIPVLIIKYISERSGACSLIADKELVKGEKVYGKIRASVIPQKDQVPLLAENSSFNKQEKVIIAASNEQKINNIVNTSTEPVNYNARLSVQNYSTFGNALSGQQRSRYSFSGKIRNIAEIFTLSTYLNYTKNENFYSFEREKRVNIYDLNLNYHPEKEFDLWIGRYLNPRISSISTVDGLQAQKKLKNYFVGALGGSRPDFNNMGYNIKLLEYGVYAGRTDTLLNGFMESTLALFQQTNNSAIDRRFIYFQHQNNILRNLNFFLSSEIDLYAREKGNGKNRLTATSIFFNSRYSPIKTLSFSLSYDARKNVIYYETFRNIADSILDKETRQGLRLGMNMRPFANASFGINAGYRYKKSDIKPSRNVGAHFSYSSIPLIKASGTVNFSKLISSYLDGINYGINIRKDISSIASGVLGIRRVEYSFTNSSLHQNILSADLTIRIFKSLFLLSGYEVIIEKKQTNHRLLFDLTARI